MKDALIYTACGGVFLLAGVVWALVWHVGRLTTAVREHDEHLHRAPAPAAGTAGDPIATAERFADGATWIP